MACTALNNTLIMLTLLKCSVIKQIITEVDESMGQRVQGRLLSLAHSTRYQTVFSATHGFAKI